jgi:RimJ/RimL family protein N-acetyltransferase
MSMFARTPRLTLRPGWPEDAPALARAIAHEQVAFKLSRLPWPYGLEHAQDWLGRPPLPDNHAFLIFAHDGRDRPELVGGMGLHPWGDDLELGYWLTPAAWGRGYATEAGRAVVGIARYALGRSRLVSRHFVDNPASGRVLRKLGFHETGRCTTPCLARGGVEVDSLAYELPLEQAAIGWRKAA